MPSTATISKSVTLGGKSFAEASKQVSGDTPVLTLPNTNVAKVGTLSAKVDADTGTFTLASHGFVDGDRVDAYFSGGSRHGMIVGTVAGDDVPIDGGAGDDLPAAAQPLTLCKVTERPFSVVGNDVKVLAVKNSSASRGQVTLVDGANAVLFHKTLPAGGVHIWDSTDGTTNELAGDTVVEAHLSQEGTVAAEVAVGVLV